MAHAQVLLSCVAEKEGTENVLVRKVIWKGYLTRRTKRQSFPVKSTGASLESLC